MRITLAGLLLLTPLPTYLEAQTIRYAPSSGQYEQTFKVSGSGVLATAGGGIGFELADFTRFALTVSSLSRDSLKVLLRVDSSHTTLNGASQSGGSLIPAGSTFERRISAMGRARRDSTVEPAMAALLATALPSIGPGARVGSVWEDTLELSGAVSLGIGSGAQGRIMRTVRVASDTVYGGEPAWKLETGSKLEVTGMAADFAGGTARAGRAGRGGRGGRAGAGAGERAGRAGLQVEAEGGGEGTGTMYLSKQGGLLFATETQKLDITITVGGGGFTLPVETTTVRTVKRIN